MAAAQGYDPNRHGQYGYIFIPGASASDSKVAGFFSGILEYDPRECPGVTSAAFFSTAVDAFAERLKGQKATFTLDNNRLRHVHFNSGSSALSDEFQAHNKEIGPGRTSNQMWGMDCSHRAIVDLVRSGGGGDPRSTLQVNSLRSGGAPGAASRQPPSRSAGADTQQQADFQNALSAAERKDAAVAAERKRFGSGRDKEIRQLVDLRERIATRRPRMCRSNATKNVINFNYLPGVMLMTRERAETIYADMKRKSATSCQQSSPAKLGPLNCDAVKGFSSCTVTMECAPVQYPCPAGAQ
ncbi:hypothetical protein [Pseudoxanthomonas sp. PXM02]|uniref:hypothetical protein n=1 Tax=Pseudoxanthomonas sp. PXM02 TaxID=2769294 RepID=UPI00177F1A60|nr:hypothetical protein [Pseudoxanthomonas sp. PXM02]MBD9478380.1 hypothetical protein [Pseudoxanthomonas sp. PXM02]